MGLFNKKSEEPDMDAMKKIEHQKMVLAIQESEEIQTAIQQVSFIAFKNEVAKMVDDMTDYKLQDIVKKIGVMEDEIAYINNDSHGSVTHSVSNMGEQNNQRTRENDQKQEKTDLERATENRENLEKELFKAKMKEGRLRKKAV